MATIAQLEAQLDALTQQLKEAERGLAKAERKAADLETRSIQAEAAASKAALESHIRAAVIDAGLNPGTVPDILEQALKSGWKIDTTGRPILERNGQTVSEAPQTQGGEATPISPLVWLQTELRQGHPWYFGADAGNPAQGRTAADPQNPWSREHWNTTVQGHLIRDHGMTKAETLAHNAGVSVYATGPAKPKPTIISTPVPAK